MLYANYNLKFYKKAIPKVDSLYVMSKNRQN